MEARSVRRIKSKLESGETPIDLDDGFDSPPSGSGAEQASNAKMDKTLVKGLAILEQLALSQGPVKLVDLARDMRLTKSGVHRLLQTLGRLGYVDVHDGGRYTLSMKLWHVGAGMIERINSRRVLHPYLNALAHNTMETVHLAMFDMKGANIVYIDKAEGHYALRVSSEVGARAPAHCVATGKVFLSHQSQSYLDGLDGKLERFTAKTITELPKLTRELAKIRRQGYAVNRGEWMEEVCGLAAPVWNASGDLEAAIGLTVPASRFLAPNRDAMIKMICDAAAEASLALGARPSIEPAAE